jgi:enoyl-CoA hydratase/carnithine racemase
MASIRSGELLVKKVGSAMAITLNRPKTLNALSHPMAVDLRDLFAKWHRGEDAHHSAIIVSGAGGKAFCAGGDVKSIWQEVVDVGFANNSLGRGTSGMLSSDFFRDEYEMNFLVGKSKIPQVSLWDGIVMGGGVGLSALGMFRIATEKSLFAMPETTIGLFPDVGSSSWLPQLEDGCGEYIGLTGARLNAGDLVTTGIATHYIKSEKLQSLQRAISDLAVADSPEEKAQRVRALLDDFSHTSGRPDYSKSVTVHHASDIQDHFHGKESVEDILASLASLPENDFASNTLSALRKMSPSSLKITFEQILRGRRLDGDLAQCLTMEYNVVQGCMRNNDFAGKLNGSLCGHNFW